MKIIKPLRLSVLKQSYRLKQQNYLGVAFIAMVNMEGKAQMWPEPELWKLTAAEIKCNNGIIDIGIPKGNAEYLITGNAYTHHQQDKTSCIAGIQIGELEKSLKVSGNRYWNGMTPSRAEPFSEMSLNWHNAFGGPKTPENPMGMGCEPEVIQIPEGGDTITTKRIPHIESLLSPVQHPDQQYAPANFNPLDMLWPQRNRFQGKQFDEYWRDNIFPGFALDTDWRLFNMASEDQIWPESDRIPAGCPFKIWNMHPEKAVQEGEIPRWTPRCFITRKSEVTSSGEDISSGNEAMEELSLRLTTVWFFPHLDKMFLIYHGSTTVKEDDAADVTNMVAAMENTANSRPVSHYRRVMDIRANKRTGALHTFREQDLMPSDAIAPWLDTEISQQQPSAMQENMERREQKLREEQNKRFADMGVPPPATPEVNKSLMTLPPLADLPDFVESVEQEAAKQQAGVMQRAIDKGVDPEKFAGTAHSKSGVETYYSMKDAIHQGNEKSLKPMSQEELEKKEQDLYYMYLMSVQSRGPAAKMSEERNSAAREHVLAIMAKDRNFKGLDLTGADLSGLDLSGGDFTRTMLESANLSDCKLDNALFFETVLARTTLHNTSFCGASFEQSNLTLADAQNCSFKAATLSRLQLEETHLQNCDFTGATLSKMQLIKLFISRCNFSQTSLEQMLFSDQEINAADFSAARLEKVSFYKATLNDVSFSRAGMKGCYWIETLLQSPNFSSASMLGCAFLKDTRAENANFTAISLTNSNFRQTWLQKAVFRNAKANNSDFSEADLRLADLSQLTAPGCMFMRCDLRGANLSRANLIKALLAKAQLRGANFEDACLYGADISQNDLDSLEPLSKAYTEKMKTVPVKQKVEA